MAGRDMTDIDPPALMTPTPPLPEPVPAVPAPAPPPVQQQPPPAPPANQNQQNFGVRPQQQQNNPWQTQQQQQPVQQQNDPWPMQQQQQPPRRPQQQQAQRPQQQPQQSYQGPTAEEKPFVMCPSAMLCVKSENCDFKGVITDQSLNLTPQLTMLRVPLIPCVNPNDQSIDVCCRDPNYVDPWPNMNGGNKNMNNGGNGNGNLGVKPARNQQNGIVQQQNDPWPTQQQQQ